MGVPLLLYPEPNKLDPSRTMFKEIALDLRRYNSYEKLSSLINDTASLSIEASSEDIPRVNPSYFVKKSEDYVVAPGRDKRDVLSMFVEDAKDTIAAKEIRNMLLQDTKNNVYVWISPSGEWPETRVQIGVKLQSKNKKIDYLKRYDVSTTLSPIECLRIGQLLISMSNEKTKYPNNPSELLELVIKLNIPDNINPYEFLSGIIQFPEENRWKSILTGEADKNKARAVLAAVNATQLVRSNPQIIFSAPVEYGAYIESYMWVEGFGMDPAKFGCGSSNITTTSVINSYNESGTFVFDYKDKYGSLRFACPKCGATNTRPIDELISNCQYCGNNVNC